MRRAARQRRAEITLIVNYYTYSPCARPLQGLTGPALGDTRLHDVRYLVFTVVMPPWSPAHGVALETQLSKTPCRAGVDFAGFGISDLELHVSGMLAPTGDDCKGP